MKVKTAKSAGFCMGVKKAMDMVIEKTQKSSLPIYTFGPLIHNPQVLQVLDKKGVKILKSRKDLKKLKSSLVVIRTHGITPEERKDLKNNVGELADGTCPRVAKVQGIIKKHALGGYTVIIIGDRKHAEVVSLLAYAGNMGYVIGGPESVEEIPCANKICVVSQTTQSKEHFEETVKAIKRHFHLSEIEVNDTLCDFTSRRQVEVRKLAKEVDALVVVGGRDSANTTRLAMIAEETGKPTYWIETENELNLEKMKQYFTVGVTAGASTPNWIINRVVETLEDTIPFGDKKWKAYLKTIFTFFIRSSLFLAVGAVCLCYTSAALQNISFNLRFGLISFFYVYSMHVINYYFHQDSIKYNEPRWYSFLHKHKYLFLCSGILSAAASLHCAFHTSSGAFVLTILGCLVGGAHGTELLSRKPNKHSKLRKLINFPCSKSLSGAMGWSLIITLVPLLSTPAVSFSWGTVVAFSFTFILVMFRSIIYDIKDVQGDSLVSRETIPIIIGTRKAKQIIILSALIQGEIFFILSVLGEITSLGYYLIFNMIYCYIYLYLFHRDIISRGTSLRFLVESQFFLAGIIAMIWNFF